MAGHAVPTTTAAPTSSCWLTRPVAQVDTLSQQLQVQLQPLGIAVFNLPLLEIVPQPLNGVAKQRVLDLDRYDLVFFISSNAAQLGLAAFDSYWPQYPAGQRYFAVGSGTAAVLQQHGLAVDYPTERMSSEALLALPSLQQITGKRALIVRGEGGRELLAQALQQRGVTVDYAELYRRQRPDYSVHYLQNCLQQHPPALIVISSGEALEHLHAFFAPLGVWPQLPLAVSSVRLAEQAQQLGNAPRLCMAGASDAAIIAAMLEFFSARRTL